MPGGGGGGVLPHYSFRDTIKPFAANPNKAIISYVEYNYIDSEGITKL